MIPNIAIVYFAIDIAIVVLDYDFELVILSILNLHALVQ